MRIEDNTRYLVEMDRMTRTEAARATEIECASLRCWLVGPSPDELPDEPARADYEATRGRPLLSVERFRIRLDEGMATFDCEGLELSAIPPGRDGPERWDVSLYAVVTEAEAHSSLLDGGGEIRTLDRSERSPASGPSLSVVP
jgi:hypothetical protein